VNAFDDGTLAFYQAEAARYVGHRPDDVCGELLPVLDLLPKGARILELGCGGGRDARHMIACGFEVDVTDGVPAMAAEATTFLGHPVRVMRFDELAAIDAYDGVVAIASLLHAPREGLPDILARIWRALRPGGYHFATFKTAAAPGYDEHGRYYNYLSRADAEACYRSAGEWSSLVFEDAMGVGYFSAPCQWLHVLAQKHTAD
jgi:SAM-dependent methyltransferase